MFFGFAKQTEKQPKQIGFRFVSVRTENKFDCFEDTLPRTLPNAAKAFPAFSLYAGLLRRLNQ
jgi:hypothetical protein